MAFECVGRSHSERTSIIWAKVEDENVKLVRLSVIPVEKDAHGKREARQLTSGPASVGGLFGPAGYDWAPDGKTIVFSHVRTPKAAITSASVTDS